MKRYTEKINGYKNFQESMFEGWNYGIRNSGKNLGILKDPLYYYIIADDNVLRG